MRVLHPSFFAISARHAGIIAPIVLAVAAGLGAGAAEMARTAWQSPEVFLDRKLRATRSTDKYHASDRLVVRKAGWAHRVDEDSVGHIF